ncbi:MAG: V-type ATPase subunit [Candidatus Bathyarchaeia archaeon]|jgi:vacuolar-type H+-ATPase subunit C/Vma6
MTGAGKYAELAAAVRCFKADLIRTSEIERVIESGSLSETVSMLTDGKVTAVDSSDLTSVESYLIQASSELAKRLVSYAPQVSRPLIRLFSRGFELSCVKEILRSIIDQEGLEEAMRHIVPAGKFTVERCEELIEGHNPNRVVDLLDDEGLKRHLSPKLTGEKGGLGVVSAIDQYYYSKLWSASNLPDLFDAQSARGLIGELIDHLNILFAFRTRLVGLDAKTTSDMMIRVNYALGHALTELAEATNAQNLMRVLDKTRYARALQGAATSEANVADVERSLNRSHATSCFNMFAGSPFKVGLAVAFLFLKNYELHDLFSIINAKANHVPMERVVDSLILRRA